MNKSRYARPIAILVAIVGAYHIVLFGLHPHPPALAAKTEVIWGDLSDKQPSFLPETAFATPSCTAALQPAADNPGSAADKMKKRVRFEYRPEADYFVNTGRAEEIVMEPGSTITIDNKTYALKQIQFYQAGTSGQRGFYLIHRADDGKVAVVAAPLQVSNESNPAIDALWRYLPQRPGEHNSLDDMHVDINNLLPHDRTYSRYTTNGSCTDAVWLSLQTPVQITADQLAKLDRVLTAKRTTTSL